LTSKHKKVVDPLDPEDPYFEATVTAVPELLTRARLYESTWVSHIEPGHPEMTELGPDEVLLTLEEPTSVHESLTNEKSVVFVRQTNTYLGHDLNVHVPVRLFAPDLGRVTTTYLSGTTYTGKKIWPLG